MLRLRKTASWKLNDFDLIFQCQLCHPRSNLYDFVYVCHRNNGHIMHRFWDISCNISLMSNWTFLTLKMTLRAYSHQRRAFFSAAETLLRIYQNPIHLYGLIWGPLADTFFRRRTSHCLQNLVRQRVWHPQMWKCRYMWKVAKCEKNSTLNVNIDAICEKITLNVKKLGSLNVSIISTLNVLKSTLYVQTLFWRYLWKSNFNAFLISER